MNDTSHAASLPSTVICCSNVGVAYQSPLANRTTLKESFVHIFGGSNDRPTEFTALKDVSFSIAPGESVAVVGPNGCGKSTLLKVIAGIVEPSSGSVSTRGIIAPLIELGAGFDQNLNGIENIYLNCALMGIPEKKIDQHLDAIIAFADLGDFIYAPVRTYSSGMYMRLGFACSTVINPEVLLIDEVLAVGDARFQAKCHQRLSEIKSRNTVIVLVSHDEEKVAELCTRGLLIWEGRLVLDDNINSVLAAYRELLAKSNSNDDGKNIVATPGPTKVARTTSKTTLAYIDRVEATIREHEASKRLEISTTVFAKSDTTLPHIEISIVDSKDQLLEKFSTASLNTKQNDESSKAQNQWKLILVLECSALASGSYKVNASVQIAGNLVDEWVHAATFTVKNSINTNNRDGNLVELSIHHFDICRL